MWFFPRLLHCIFLLLLVICMKFFLLDAGRLTHWHIDHGNMSHHIATLKGVLHDTLPKTNSKSPLKKVASNRNLLLLPGFMPPQFSGAFAVTFQGGYYVMETIFSSTEKMSLQEINSSNFFAEEILHLLMYPTWPCGRPKKWINNYPTSLVVEFQCIWKILVSVKLDHETAGFWVKIPQKKISCHHQV